MFPLVVLCALALTLPFIFSQLRKRWNLRLLKNVPGPTSRSFLTGVSKLMYTTFAVPYREHVLGAYGRVVKIPMPLGDLDLAVSDPVALTAIFSKYRDVYDIPAWFLETMNAVFGPGLASVRLQEHHRIRKQLNPVFSVRYLRDMMPALNRIGMELTTVIRNRITHPQTELDISQYLSRYSLECIGRTGLGYSFGSLDSEGTDYSRALKEFGPTLSKLHMWRRTLPWLRRTFPHSWLRFVADRLPYAPLRHMVGISDSVYITAQQVLGRKMELLKQGLELSSEVGEGKDLMSVLLRQNMVSGELSEDNLIGHMSLLLLAATDTTSSTISRAVEVLARHRDVQQKLRQELVAATAGAGRSLADFDYDAYMGLPYLEAVVRETIRMYPVFQISPKVADEDTVLPLGRPILGTDGTPMTEIIVPAGTTVWVNIFGLNRDKDIWGPDADVWRPERWLAPLPATVADAHIPSVFANTMTFIAGSRACIGYNMALTELRIALAHLVLAFELAPSEKEIEWRLGGIISPGVKGSPSMKPELPVLISSIS